jgi:hypothetical protein
MAKSLSKSFTMVNLLVALQDRMQHGFGTVSTRGMTSRPLCFKSMADK